MGHPLFLREGPVVAGFRGGAGFAEDFAVAMDFAIVVDAFAAEFAADAGGFVPRHLAGVDGDCDPLFAEEVFIREFAVGEHLLLVFVFDVGVEVAGALLGGFEGGDADGFVDGGVVLGGERRGEVDEGGGHFAPVAEFDGALAEAAAGDDGDSVGGAAIDFDEGDEALAVFRVDETLGVVDAEALATQHRESDAEDLTGAEVAVGDFGLMEESVEGLHKLMILLAGEGVFFGRCALLSGGGSIRFPR